MKGKSTDYIYCYVLLQLNLIDLHFTFYYLLTIAPKCPPKMLKQLNYITKGNKLINEDSKNNIYINIARDYLLFINDMFCEWSTPQTSLPI